MPECAQGGFHVASPERDGAVAWLDRFEPSMPRRMRPQSLPAEYQRISASGSTLEPAAACLRDDATSMSRIESPPCTAAPCLAPTLGSWANRSCRVIPGGCFEPPSLRPACDVARWLLVVVWVALRVVSVVWHDGERWSGVVHGGPGARAGERGRR